MKRRATWIPTARERRNGIAALSFTIALAFIVWASIITALLNGWA